METADRTDLSRMVEDHHHSEAMKSKHTPASSPISTSPVESSSNATTATTTTAHEMSEIEEADISNAAAREQGTHSRHTTHHDTSDSQDDNESEDISEELEDKEDERDEHRLPRQGLPSFWYALRRLNLRDPGSILRSLNFFRWHVIIGIFVPLITAGIFCAVNTQVTIAYIDAVFMCTSALTLTGLSSVLLADMSFGQQFILYLLMQFGSIQFVSLLVLLIRRSTFSKKFSPNESYWPHKTFILKTEDFNLANDILEDPDEVPKLHKHMLKKKVKSRERKTKLPDAATAATNDVNKDKMGRQGNGQEHSDHSQNELVTNGDGMRNSFQLKRMNSPLSMKSDDYAAHPLKKKSGHNGNASRQDDVQNHSSNIARQAGTSTSTSHPLDKHRRRMRQRTIAPPSKGESNSPRKTTIRKGTNISNSTSKKAATTSSFTTRPNVQHHQHRPHQSSRGGFPNPINAVFSEGIYQLRKRTDNRNSSHSREFQRFESGLHGHSLSNNLSQHNDGGARILDRSNTQPSRRMSLSARQGTGLATASRIDDSSDLEAGYNNGANAMKHAGGEKVEDPRNPTRKVSMPSSAYRFGRNSTVRDLSKEAHLKLAQLEISSMSLLIYIILIWWIGLQLLFVIIWSPYFEAGHFEDVFQQYNPSVSRTWFSVFQVSSMLNNCGLSLVDGSLTPFRTCFIMLVPAVFLMVVGNLGYPISLRFTIWLVHTCLRATSKLRFITSFMLAHPRRIFYYIFPPYETQALFLVVMLLTVIDWGCYFLLDINYTSPVFAISRGTGVLSGLVQAVAVRSAGFYTVPLYQVAPALDMLYLFMMAFCVYPLALAIRATNVYEEKALGIQHDNEPSLRSGLYNLRREKGYTKFHLREQLAYDVWYILLAYWLICIVERNNIGITGADPAGSIDMFAILFEVTSAYANVGFSIGSPTTDTSISGNLKHLSKLILCATMIRGRTRGLPVLLDRAVLTPRQLERYGDPADGGATDEE